MRALMLHGAGDLRLEEVPDPRPGPGEVVVAVEAALTCATDAKMAASGAHPALGPLPAPLGHEAAGVVALVGEGVTRVREGERVVVANSAPCGGCADCRAGRPNLCPGIVFLTGAFAERLLVPAAIVARNTHPLPEGLAPEAGALAEPFACAVHTVGRLGDLGGREALVLGGGVQGQSLTRLLAAAGAAVHLADPHPDRRARAVRMGAAAVHEAPRDDAGVEALRAAIGDGRGAGLVIEAVGRPQAWRAAVALARPGGDVVLHGGCPAGSVVELPTHALHYSEITLRGSFHHTPAAFRAALDYLSHDVNVASELLREEIALEDVPRVLTASRGEKHPVRPRT